ncbi:ABC transporter ATP-binding protein [Saccharibacillus kuerlensis]|uniref:Lipid A ABC transporter permease/ATP-binding protein n=1 Tax=Saccharibacillus kuerlensis TaxID=459527 RepID=A0ABQ2L0L6_9BACL|nr:lipid A ABC transporter permease/ATP-binding protein [Saccharibacillus kuerlensis]
MTNLSKKTDHGGDARSSEQKLSASSTLKLLMNYARPHRLAFVGVAFCALLGISAELLQPLLVQIAIDNHIVKGEGGGALVKLGLLYLGIAIVSFVFTYLQNNLLQYAGQSIVARIRKDLFGHISKMSMSFFDRTHSGSLVTNVSNDTETISQFFTQVLLSLVRDGMMLILIIVLMFSLDARLAAFSLLILPVIFVVAALFRSYLRSTYQQARSKLSRLIAFTAENLSGMGLIQSFRQEEEQLGRFTEQNRNYWNANLRQIRSNVLFNRTFDILGNAALVLMVWLGGRAVLGETMEVGVLYAFVSYIRQFFQPINQITMQWNTFQSTTVAVERIQRVLETKPDVREPSEPERLPLKLDSIRGEVDFRNVSFGYRADRPVLKKLNLHLKAGEMIGVVGTTGAGKSTLISLLNRFYDVNEGSIQIDGTDIRRISGSDLHAAVGLIQQDPYLFSGSIVDNVRLFREDITREQVMGACRFVGAHPMIMRLQNGYDTHLSERGSGLSAGERQLISFARIVVFQPKILILDEATANLDSETEKLVQEALSSVSQGRTTIVIAHRLSTIMHADRILVMKDGQLTEQGTHAQLLTLGGHYAELYRHARQSGREQLPG